MSDREKKRAKGDVVKGKEKLDSEVKFKLRARQQEKMQGVSKSRHACVDLQVPPFKDGEGLQWILGDSITQKDFFQDHWEKAPLHISRGVKGKSIVVVSHNVLYCIVFL